MKEVGLHSSRSCNYNVNGGPTMGGKMGTDEAMGKSTERDATNVISKPGSKPGEVSPSATCQSKNC